MMAYAERLTGEIRQHFLSGKSLTTLDAQRLYGTSRLAVYIDVYRKEGLPIVDTWIKMPDCLGTVKDHKRYWLDADYEPPQMQLL